MPARRSAATQELDAAYGASLVSQGCIAGVVPIMLLAGIDDKQTPISHGNGGSLAAM